MFYGHGQKVTECVFIDMDIRLWIKVCFRGYGQNTYVKVSCVHKILLKHWILSPIWNQSKQTHRWVIWNRKILNWYVSEQYRNNLWRFGTVVLLYSYKDKEYMLSLLMGNLSVANNLNGRRGSGCMVSESDRRFW